MVGMRAEPSGIGIWTMENYTWIFLTSSRLLFSLPRLKKILLRTGPCVRDDEAVNPNGKFELGRLTLLKDISCEEAVGDIIMEVQES